MNQFGNWNRSRRYAENDPSPPYLARIHCFQAGKHPTGSFICADSEIGFTIKFYPLHKLHCDWSNPCHVHCSNHEYLDYQSFYYHYLRYFRSYFWYYNLLLPFLRDVCCEYFLTKRQFMIPKLFKVSLTHSLRWLIIFKWSALLLSFSIIFKFRIPLKLFEVFSSSDFSWILLLPPSSFLIFSLRS